MMNVIDHLNSEKELNDWKAHVAKVMKLDLSNSFRPSTLEKVSAHLAGAENWNTALGIVRKREDVGISCCKRCESGLMPNGFCSDETCFHSDWPQSSDGSNPLEERVEVFAQFESGDGKFVTDFDAVPYFQFLLDKYPDIAQGRIEKVIREGGTGCDESDDIARSFSDANELKPYCQFPGYSTILAAFHSFDAPDNPCTTFEVYLDEESLLRWIELKCPDLYDDLDEDMKAG